jgi:hypothetical protein
MMGHAALPDLDEDVSIVEFLAAFGIQAAFVTMETDEFVEYVIDKNLTGLLVNVATPVREYFEGEDSNSYSFSWGHYSTEWLYGEDLAALLPKIEAWIKERSEEDRRKSARKAA